jgi:hypothetical protein
MLQRALGRAFVVLVGLHLLQLKQHVLNEMMQYYNVLKTKQNVMTRIQ